MIWPTTPPLWIGCTGPSHRYLGAKLDGFMTVPQRVPRELEIRGIYFSPLLLTVILAVIATWFTCKLLNRYGLYDHFEQPVLVYISLVLIYSFLIGTFIIPS
jgi:hypothetical protein